MDSPARLLRRTARQCGSLGRQLWYRSRRNVTISLRGRTAWKRWLYDAIGGYPYVNGYGFLALADHYMLVPGRDNRLVNALPHTVNPAQARPGDIFFVNTKLLEAFFNDVEPHLPGPYTLITARLDGVLTQQLADRASDRLLHWFALNVEAQHPRITPIPLGMQPIDEFIPNWDVSDLRILHRVLKERHAPTKGALLSFNDKTNPAERGACRSALAHLPFVDDLWFERMEDFWRAACQYRFILSPAGLEPDCFRHWGAWLIGAIPILRRHSVLEPFYHLPAWWVNDWAEVTEDEMERKWSELAPQRRLYPELFQRHWVERIAETINRPDLLDIVPEPDLSALPLHQLRQSQKKAAPSEV